MSKIESNISLRGHHLVLLYGFLFKGRENSIRDAATEEHGKLHADNVINVLKKISELDTKVKLIDTTDDICSTCDKKDTRICKEFIRYGISAASEDRATAYNSGFRMNRIYTAKHIVEKLKKTGDWIEM